MGRGRGRGRKIANGRTHEDKGSSGEEVVAPVRKRRGRPQKRVAEKIQQAAAEVKNHQVQVDDGDEDYHQMAAGDDAKLKASPAAGTGANNKRNRVVPKEEEDDSNLLDMEENSSSTRSSNDESTRSNGGFRQVGSRRKSTPRRAAEAGL